MPSRPLVFVALVGAATLTPSLGHAQERAQEQAPAARPALDDPMLEPLAPPAKTLRSWQDAVRHITARDADYASAIADIDRAEGIRREALAQALPTLTASGNVMIQLIRRDGLQFIPGQGVVPGMIPPSPVWTGQLIARQPLLAPRAWYAIGTADGQTEIAKLSLEDRRRRLVTVVASTVVSLVTSERLAEINRVGLRAALDRLELTKRRSVLGAGTALDIVRFEQDVAMARAAVVTGDEQVRRTREALGIALGSDEPWGVPPSFSLDELARSAAATCAAEDETRADVRAARAQIKLAERGVTDADLLYLPTAEVISTTTVSSFFLNTSEFYAWTVHGLITIPLWDGGARYGARRAAQAEIDRTRQIAEATERSVSVEQRQARRAIDVAEQSLEVALQNQELAIETERLSQLAFEAGAGTGFDLVDASRRRREAELTLAVRELELVEAKLAVLLVSARCTY